MIYTDDSICIRIYIYVRICRNVCRQEINIGISYLEKNIIGLYLSEDLGKQHKFRTTKWSFVPLTSVSMMSIKGTLSYVFYFTAFFLIR